MEQNMINKEEAFEAQTLSGEALKYGLFASFIPVPFLDIKWANRSRAAVKEARRANPYGSYGAATFFSIWGTIAAWSFTIYISFFLLMFILGIFAAFI